MYLYLSVPKGKDDEKMVLKVGLLLVFFAVMIGVGLYCRKNSTDVNGFVLGGRSVGPWLTAFAYGTSYFSAVIFVGYAGQFGWKFGIASTWIGIGNAVFGSLLAWMVLWQVRFLLRFCLVFTGRRQAKHRFGQALYLAGDL